MITLLFAWLLSMFFTFDSSQEPFHSLQLSSNGSAPAYPIYGYNPYPIAGLQAKQFEVQMDIVRPQMVNLESSGKIETLVDGDVVSITVPGNALGGTTDASKVNIDDVINYINNQSGPAPFGGHRNEVEIVESKREEIIGETVKLRLANLSRSQSIRIKNIEEAESDDVSEASEGQVVVDCNSGNCSSRNSILDTWNYVMYGVRRATEPMIRTIDDVVNSFVNSDFNKKLQEKLRTGFTMRTGSSSSSGRSITIKDGVVSRPHRKCLRGVKTALLRSGAVSKYLPGEKAKHFGGVLKKEGFINLLETDYKSKIKSPHDGPVGAVYVYSGGSAGHAEIKTEKGFISDYFSKEPRTGSAANGLHGKSRKLIGVYIQGSEEINNYLAMNK